MVKAVAYLRVSEEDETVENQRLAILDFAKRKGMEVVAWFTDDPVSGTVPPREREGYRAMLKFCRDNGIKTVIFYDLSRLARSVEEGLLELKRLTEEGFNFYFAGMEFLNYIDDPMLKKKIILDFLWFAELYVEDIRRRTKVAIERLKREGKLYHRPPTPLPLDLIRQLRKKGLDIKLAFKLVEKGVFSSEEVQRLVGKPLPFTKIYRVLVSLGYLRYRERGEERVMSYHWFLKRLKREAPDLFSL